VGDLVRTFIQRGLGTSAPPRTKGDQKADHARQLRGIARCVLKLADEVSPKNRSVSAE